MGAGMLLGAGAGADGPLAAFDWLAVIEDPFRGVDEFEDGPGRSTSSNGLVFAFAALLDPLFAFGEALVDLAEGAKKGDNNDTPSSPVNART